MIGRNSSSSTGKTQIQILLLTSISRARALSFFYSPANQWHSDFPSTASNEKREYPFFTTRPLPWFCLPFLESSCSVSKISYASNPEKAEGELCISLIVSSYYPLFSFSFVSSAKIVGGARFFQLLLLLDRSSVLKDQTFSFCIFPLFGETAARR